MGDWKRKGTAGHVNPCKIQVQLPAQWQVEFEPTLSWRVSGTALLGAGGRDLSCLALTPRPVCDFGCHSIRKITINVRKCPKEGSEDGEKAFECLR